MSAGSSIIHPRAAFLSGPCSTGEEHQPDSHVGHCKTLPEQCFREQPGRAATCRLPLGPRDTCGTWLRAEAAAGSFLEVPRGWCEAVALAEALTSGLVETCL